MTLTPNPEQLAIGAHFRDREAPSLLVRALAGTGKTTTLADVLAPSVPETICLGLAFNKSIATELSQRLPRGWTASTSNALGHRAWARKVSPRKVELKQDKLFSLAKGLNLEKDQFGDVLSLVKAARNFGLVPQGASAEGLIPDTRDEWEALADHFDLECNLELIDLSRKLLHESISQALRGLIDFQDQIYMSVLWKAPHQRFQFLAVDEAQDLTALQHAQIRASLLPSSRIVAVGDPFQAIYGFRGAMHDSIDQLQWDFNLVSLPLSTNYRCSQRVIEEAQKIVPDIRFHEGAPEGSVENLGEAWSPEDLRPGSAVLCRNTKPLIRLAFRCLRAGIGAKIKGRDIGAGLAKLVRKLAPEVQPTPLFLARLDSWASKEIARRPRNEPRIIDKQESIRALAEECSNTHEIIRYIERLFSDEASLLTLSTIHRAKGLEWPTVYLLDEHLMPSTFATQDWQFQQEENLRYVAVTRAKLDLFYIYS